MVHLMSTDGWDSFQVYIACDSFSGCLNKGMPTVLGLQCVGSASERYLSVKDGRHFDALLVQQSDRIISAVMHNLPNLCILKHLFQEPQDCGVDLQHVKEVTLAICRNLCTQSHHQACLSIDSTNLPIQSIMTCHAHVTL